MSGKSALVTGVSSCLEQAGICAARRRHEQVSQAAVALQIGTGRLAMAALPHRRVFADRTTCETAVSPGGPAELAVAANNRVAGNICRRRAIAVWQMSRGAVVFWLIKLFCLCDFG